MTTAKENISESSTQIRLQVSDPSEVHRPFAVVEGDVDQGSPAYQAGIRTGR
jgi:hypothetical protein